MRDRLPHNTVPHDLAADRNCACLIDRLALAVFIHIDILVLLSSPPLAGSASEVFRRVVAGQPVSTAFFENGFLLVPHQGSDR